MFVNDIYRFINKIQLNKGEFYLYEENTIFSTGTIFNDDRIKCYKVFYKSG